jgi:hypothetical protein
MQQTRLLVNNPVTVNEEDALRLYQQAFCAFSRRDLPCATRRAFISCLRADRPQQQAARGSSCNAIKLTV